MGRRLTPSTALTQRRVRAPLPERVDVAVVGAGLGGLMSAAALSRAGLKVAVFDPHYVAGGCATMYARGHGQRRYQFDVGLHYVGECGPGGKLAELLEGVGARIEWERMDPDGYDTLLFPDLTFPIPAGVEAYRERLLSFFPGEVRGVDRYVRLLTELDGLLTELGDEPLSPTSSALFRVLRRAPTVMRYQRATLAELFEDLTRDPILRAVLGGQHGDYALPPSEVGAVIHAGISLHYLKQGAFYPRGGGQRIADALAAQIEAQGGSVHLRTRVERVLLRGGRAVGLRLRREGGGEERGEVRELPAAQVISGADLKKTVLELLDADALPSHLRSEVRAYKMAGALFLLCLGVDADLGELGLKRRNYWHFDGYDTERLYRDAEHDLRPGSAYFTSATLKDPGTAGHAPAGGSTLQIVAIAGADPALWGIAEGSIAGGRYRKSPAYLKNKEIVEESLLLRLERAFPEVAARVVFRESATPITHSRYTAATLGTGYGIASTPGQLLHHRPGARAPIEGLYLAGASTRSGHGIIGALRSGQIAARALLEDRAQPTARRRPALRSARSGGESLGGRAPEREPTGTD